MELTSDGFDAEQDSRRRRDSGGKLDFENFTLEKAIVLIIAAATAIFVGLEIISASGGF